MDIKKHKEILALRTELESLNQEYTKKRSAAEDYHTDLLLTEAIKEFIAYVEKEGFSVEEDQYGIIKANLDDIEIKLDRKPRIFSISMPNVEKYSVSIDATTEEYTYKISSIYSQDTELNSLNKTIEDLKKELSLIDDQEYRYVLSYETYDRSTGVEYKRKPFLKFQDILSFMFS